MKCARLRNSFSLKQLYLIFALLIVGGAFRVIVAHRWPNDAPGDGIVYAQMARNLLEQHVFSHATEAPFTPSLIRLPGYPFFLATVYSVFGHTNNGAVRITQALIDTLTCVLIALLAFYWQPDEKRRSTTAIAALALAIVCPFTTVYATTILTEVPTNFLLMAMFLSATLALRNQFTNENNFRRTLWWWALTGLIGGLVVFLRPDSGLFAAAIGLTFVFTTLWSALRSSGPSKELAASRTRRGFRKTLTRLFVAGATFSLAFILVLTPWTIRNWSIFHLFQPLSPPHGEMPGEFVAHGYYRWIRTWLDDEQYIETFIWPMDEKHIDIEDLPSTAYDSAEEKERVAELLDQYNNPTNSETDSADQSASEPAPSPTPEASADENSDQNDQKGDEDESPDEEEQSGPVEMTPEIDAGFAQIARERISRHPFRVYVWLPIKRAGTMWLDTHSQYWPFEGRLLPLADLDHDLHQQFWLPLFAGLTALYTVLGLTGGLVLWLSRDFFARKWLVLVALAILLRLLLFSFLENPEPRYLVEFFPFLSALGGIAIARLQKESRHYAPADAGGSVGY